MVSLEANIPLISHLIYILTTLFDRSQSCARFVKKTFSNPSRWARTTAFFRQRFPAKNYEFLDRKRPHSTLVPRAYVSDNRQSIVVIHWRMTKYVSDWRMRRKIAHFSSLSGCRVHTRHSLVANVFCLRQWMTTIFRAHLDGFGKVFFTKCAQDWDLSNRFVGI